MGRTARLDRSVLVLLGVLLTAAGVLTLLVGLGTFGSTLRNNSVVDNAVGRLFGHNGPWLWPLVALVGLLLGYLALRWLAGQLAPTAVRDLELDPGSTTGQTELSSGAVTGAVSGEIRGYRGVSGASARFTGDELAPALHLRVRLDARADVVAVRERIESQAVAHVRQALEDPDLPVVLDLAVTDKKPARVS